MGNDSMTVTHTKAIPHFVAIQAHKECLGGGNVEGKENHFRVVPLPHTSQEPNQNQINSMLV